MYVVIFLIIVSVVYIPYMKKHMNNRKKTADDFLSAHPDAARVYLKTGMKGMLSSEETTIFSVNDQDPVFFYENRTQGVLLLPGKNVIEVAYGQTRPGILHKNVTTQITPSKQELEIEAGKRYRLGFNMDEKSYMFEEL